jgi:hypothetical protein
MADWTKGPYSTKPETDYCCAQVFADGQLIADVYGESQKARKATTELFAAAPKLYRQLEIANDNLALIHSEEHDINPSCASSIEVCSCPLGVHWRNNRAVLAKARGEKI